MFAGVLRQVFNHNFPLPLPYNHAFNSSTKGLIVNNIINLSVRLRKEYVLHCDKTYQYYTICIVTENACHCSIGHILPGGVQWGGIRMLVQPPLGCPLVWGLPQPQPEILACRQTLQPLLKLLHRPHLSFKLLASHKVMSPVRVYRILWLLPF